jgi:tetratricopeptide (TPR) repeat protein
MLKFMRVSTALFVCAALAASGAFAGHGGGGGGGGGGHGGGGGFGGGGGGGHMGGGGFGGGGGGGHFGGGGMPSGHFGGGGMPSSGHFSGGGMPSGHMSGRSLSVPQSHGGGMSIPRGGSSFGSSSSRGGMSIPQSSGNLGSRGQPSMHFNNGQLGTSHGNIGHGQFGTQQHNGGLSLGQRHVGSPNMMGHTAGHQSGTFQQQGQAHIANRAPGQNGGPGSTHNGQFNHQPGGNGQHQTSMLNGNRHDGGQFGNNNGGNWNGNNHGNGNWGNNGGWNGHYRNHYGSWHHGFWPIGFWGFSPWWGGYGGYGLGYGYGLGGLGFGYGGYGYGGYGYGGYGYGGYGYGGYGLGGYGWGYSPLLYSSGYYPYYNPYCTGPLVLGSTVIDYSQPVTVAGANQATPDDATTAAAMAEFDNARAAFKNGDYDAALAGVDRALQLIPDDGVLHEFRALVLFAQGNYQEAAATIHSVLAGGPGWDWDTLRSLYPDVATYTVQLRALEAYARNNPAAADARFLLAYHYLSCGYADAGLDQLKRVVALQPDDTVAQELIKSMSPGSQTPTPAPPANGSSIPETPPAQVPAEPGLPPAPPQAVPSGGPPAAGTLIGAWSATRDDGSSFSLALDKDGSFQWDYNGNGESNSLKGTYTLANDLLVLEPENGGAMVGRVSESADGQFRFQLVGGPPGDPGLTFKK